MTPAMQDRTKYAHVRWEESLNFPGYHYGIGSGYGVVAYVALPKDHPDAGKDYHDDSLEFGPDVNGGLTFAEDNVFGWDYCHAFNHHDVDGDIQRALEFFKAREKK